MPNSSRGRFVEGVCEVVTGRRKGLGTAHSVVSSVRVIGDDKSSYSRQETTNINISLRLFPCNVWFSVQHPLFSVGSVSLETS